MKDTLLLIGDENSDRSALHDLFEPNYYLLEAENAEQGSLLLWQNSHCILAVIADIPFTDENAVRMLVEAGNPEGGSEIPIVFLIAAKGSQRQEEVAFLLGAADVVHKPYSSLTMQKRLQVLEDLYRHRWELERILEEQYEVVRNTYQTTLDTLSAVIEYRNLDSGNHVLRIRGMTQILLREIADCYPEYGLNQETIDTISSASALHDIGKIAIPDAILNKPSSLTPEEREIMQTHTIKGSELVSHLGDGVDTMYLRYTYNICLYHHERWDGGGYPYGLKGDAIPICAQAVGLTDAFDALTTQRPYKPAFPYEVAINMILNGECGAFSPKLLNCFKRVHKELTQLAKRYADGYSPKSDNIQIPLPGPTQRAHSLDSLQLAQMKYQSLLHHINDTVIELDVDNQVFHVVYNPNPDFVSLLSNASFYDLGDRMMRSGFHPEDAHSIGQMQQVFSERLFRKNQPKCTFQCRIFSPPHNAYHRYEVTLLRVNTELEDQRIVIAVFHNLEQDIHSPPPQMKKMLDAPAFYDLIDVRLCCLADEALTILEGSNLLLPMTGYSPGDIRELFGNSLMQMVLPEDRGVLEAMNQKREHGSGRQEGQCRIRCRDGSSLWVLVRCRFHTDENGEAIYYYTLTDIACVKAEQQKLEALHARDRVLINQSTGIIFEWDMEKDIFTCSEKWKLRFGYDNELPNFSQSLQNAPVHPEDLPQLREKMKGLLQHSCTTVIDMRIVNREGRYCWSRVRASSVANSDGKITTIVGIIHDIHDLKSDALSLKQQASHDGLTKLLNKNATQIAVTEYLEHSSSQSISAMMILDLDNFKMANDKYGHLYGDALLAQISTSLRSLFRSQDIIGRIGGDEFLVFLKDIPSISIAEERCSLVVNSLRDQLHRLMKDTTVSISVGCALAPEHGSTWVELVAHADEALYTAKRNGKGQYWIYSNYDRYQVMAQQLPKMTSIDSDEQPVLNDDTLVRFIFQSLYESRDLDATIGDVLSLVGNFFDVSRVYIFENNEDNTHCSNTFEWCNTGIWPEKDNLQNLGYETDVPNWPEVYDDQGILYCTDIHEMDPLFQQILEPQGIKSMLHCAIMHRGVFRGFVGFDQCNKSSLWTQGQVSLLKFIAQVLSVFLVNQRSADRQKK